jgi:tetratricopeptide (TPR) repeat protein
MKKPMPPLIRQSLQKALALQQSRQLGAAIGEYRKVLALDPQNFDALQLLGLACFQAGDPALAVETLTKAIKVNKAYAPAYNNRGLAHQALRNWADAQRDFSKAIELAPGYAEAHGNRGNVLRELGRTADAIADQKKAIALNPNIPELHNNLGLACKDANQWGAALACFEKALLLRPPYLDALVNRANTLKQMNRLEEAVAGYESVLRLKPDHAEALANRGDALRDLRRRDEAAASYRKAVALKPDYAAAWCGLAQVDAESGRLRAAEDNYRQAHRLDPHAVAPLYGIAQAVKFESGDPLIPKFKELLSREDLTNDDRAKLHHAYAKVCNDLRQHVEAFDNFLRGKKLLRSSFDPARHAATYAGMKKLFTRDFLAAREGFGLGDARPVFVVGMPRSGTTLVEQVLASHHSVAGLGELPHMARIADVLGGGLSVPADYFAGLSRLDAPGAARFAAEYLGAYRGCPPEALRIIDKLPHNFERLGLIALLFPKARIIHCRRDPLDTCVSIFMQSYIGTHEYAYDLSMLSRYYREYEALMAHWREVLPLPIFECSYEDMVRSFEPTTRALLDFLGLDWDPACLDYHQRGGDVSTASLWQVRQPLYDTSMHRWRRYEKHLGPLKAGLGLA